MNRFVLFVVLIELKQQHIIYDDIMFHWVSESITQTHTRTRRPRRKICDNAIWKKYVSIKKWMRKACSTFVNQMLFIILIYFPYKLTFDISTLFLLLVTVFPLEKSELSNPYRSIISFDICRILSVFFRLIFVLFCFHLLFLLHCTYESARHELTHTMREKKKERKREREPYR